MTDAEKLELMEVLGDEHQMQRAVQTSLLWLILDMCGCKEAENLVAYYQPGIRLPLADDDAPAESFTIIVQRDLGKSPAVILQEQRDKIEELRVLVEEAAEDLSRHKDTMPLARHLEQRLGEIG